MPHPPRDLTPAAAEAFRRRRSSRLPGVRRDARGPLRAWGATRTDAVKQAVAMARASAFAGGRQRQIDQSQQVGWHAPREEGRLPRFVAGPSLRQRARLSSSPLASAPAPSLWQKNRRPTRAPWRAARQAKTYCWCGGSAALPLVRALRHSEHAFAELLSSDKRRQESLIIPGNACWQLTKIEPHRSRPLLIGRHSGHRSPSRLNGP
jgi:hypothetical protein